MEAYNFEMTLNDEVIKAWKDNFLSYLEVEIMQGEVTKLPNGQTLYKMNVGSDKEQMVRTMIIEMIKLKNYNAN